MAAWERTNPKAIPRRRQDFEFISYYPCVLSFLSQDIPSSQAITPSGSFPFLPQQLDQPQPSFAPVKLDAIPAPSQTIISRLYTYQDRQLQGTSKSAPAPWLCLGFVLLILFHSHFLASPQPYLDRVTHYIVRLRTLFATYHNF